MSQGHLFEIEKLKIDKTGIYLKTEIQYRDKNYEGCPVIRKKRLWEYRGIDMELYESRKKIFFF